jgi:hypothetical protein
MIKALINLADYLTVNTIDYEPGTENFGKKNIEPLSQYHINRLISP